MFAAPYNATPHYWRAIAPSGSGSSCGLPAEIADNATPYALYTVHSKTTAPLEAYVSPEATELEDTLLYVYCHPFDAAEPAANLLAVNDDYLGALSGFDASDEIVLDAGVQYDLVLTVKQGHGCQLLPGEEGEQPEWHCTGESGNYTLCLGENLSLRFFEGEVEDGAPEACESGYTQNPDTSVYPVSDPTTWPWGAHWDNFANDGTPITGLTWWGAVEVDAAGEAICSVGSTFEVTLGTDNESGSPDDVATETVETVRTHTGVIFESPFSSTFTFALVRYEAVLSAPVAIGDGWMSIHPLFAPGYPPCAFWWVGSATGITGAMFIGMGGISPVSEPHPDNFAFCLIHADAEEALPVSLPLQQPSL